MVVVRSRFTSRRKHHGMKTSNKAMSDCGRKMTSSPLLLLVIAVSVVASILVVTIKYVHNDSWGPNSNGPKVIIKQGSLRGSYSVTRKGRDVVSFLGIPYAAPPVGNLRFRAPHPPYTWLGTRDATEDGHVCLQLSDSGIIGQEDCLFLNVHTPQLPDESSMLMPVMVWIHGGGFFSGTGNTELFKPTYLLDKDIVLVTLNYRLGPLGFVSTGDEALPGNYGMKDQVAALVWVQNNIATFGGDPHNVALFGGSAGSSCVHYHMLSPLSRGLFQKAISQSGTALGPFALVSTETAYSRAIKIAELVGCPDHPTSEIASCLRTKSASLITSKMSYFQKWGGIPTVAFAPVVEHSGKSRFLPDTPLAILKTNRSAPVPWMTGVNAQDGCVIAETILVDPTKIEQLNEEFNDLILDTTYLDGEENSTGIADMIRKFYFGDNPIDSNTMNEVVNMYTDSYFMYPMNRSVELQVAGSSTNTYVYYFTYVGAASYSVLYGDTTRSYGSCHGDELIYLFPFNTNITLTQEDYKMVDIMTTLWTNFAKTGMPTNEVTKFLPVAWDAVTPTTGNYLEIGTHLYRRSNLLPLQVKLWRYVFHWVYNNS